MNFPELDFKEIVDHIAETHKVENTDFLREIKVISLMGKIASGKNTLADYLTAHYDYQQVSFGSWLKFYTHFYTDIPEKPKPQRFYQFFGQKCREIDPDIWIKCAIHSMWVSFSYSGTRKFVITDLRQPNERLFCHKYNFPVIKIHCDLDERIRRIRNRGVEPTPEMLNHETEQWVDILTADCVADNTGSLEFAKNSIDYFLRSRFENR